MMNIYNFSLKYLVGCQSIDDDEIIESKNVDIYGCTDPKACNYNKNANINDNSCEYVRKGLCNCNGDEPKLGYDCDGNKLNELNSDVAVKINDNEIRTITTKNVFAIQINWNKIILEEDINIFIENNENYQIWSGPEGFSIFCIGDIPLEKNLKICKVKDINYDLIKDFKCFDKDGSKFTLCF